MKITVHAEGTANEIHAKLLEVANHFIIAPNSAASAPPAAAKNTKQKAEAPKVETPAAAPAADNDLFGEDKPAAPVAPAAPKVTKKELIDKMTLVTSLEKDMATAKKILSDFGAKKLSDVKEEKWGEFVAACDKALGK